jgi:hypothetical protein
MTAKEIIELANLQKSVAAATSSESVIAIQSWGVQMTARGMIDTFGECDREDIDSDRYYLATEVKGVRFFALTDDEEMEELEELS